ncbi:hypothetical protein SORBI_3003G080300 [Sorghum bicolor]|uniref:Wall-associated receptor kinase galacturonan-binding domain-containing protein n=1 Tax=Sorghum bicolor TaxID=4558 RepID=A0A1W0VW58_SORBI|nr:hypothetical protein SORBI_3003G080300 [Sorghum bicolor]
MIQPVAAAPGPGGEHCPPVLCGNVTVSFPFGLILDNQTSCGDIGIGFKVHCYNNSSLYLEYSQSDISLQILSIFYDNRSLHIAPRRYWHPYFNTSSSSGGCRIPTADTIPVLAPPLSNSPANQNLIFYNCTKPPPQGAGLVETVCHNNTYVRAADGRSDESAGSYLLEGCNFTMVPVLGVSGKKVNASDYEQLVRDGFLATWPPPPLPLPPLPPPLPVMSS